MKIERDTLQVTEMFKEAAEAEFNWTETASQIAQIRIGVTKLEQLLEYQQLRIMQLIESELDK